MCVDTGITHLAYTDDLFLFPRADESTVELLVDYIAKFGTTARLHYPNLKKSNIYLVGVNDQTKNSLP